MLLRRGALRSQRGFESASTGLGPPDSDGSLPPATGGRPTGFAGMPPSLPVTPSAAKQYFATSDGFSLIMLARIKILQSFVNSAGVREGEGRGGGGGGVRTEHFGRSRCGPSRRDGAELTAHVKSFAPVQIKVEHGRLRLRVGDLFAFHRHLRPYPIHRHHEFRCREVDIVSAGVAAVGRVREIAIRASVQYPERARDVPTTNSPDLSLSEEAKILAQPSVNAAECSFFCTSRLTSATIFDPLGTREYV